MAIGAEGVAPTLQQKIWLVQVLEDLRRSILAGVATTEDLRAILRAFVFVLGCFMILYPLWVMIRFYVGGTLFISPPLLLMLVGGLVGIGLLDPRCR